MKRALTGCLLGLAYIACGGGGSPPPSRPALPVSVSISPTSASVEVSGTQQFTATVSNTTNKAVTWQVNGIAGGNSSVGTISNSGLYTAPATVPSPNAVTVTAVSNADSSKSASATVTITPPISVSISPTSATVPAGATQQFTATVQNTSNTAVSWRVNGVTGGNSSTGTVSAAGRYTAPTLPPPAGTVQVTAVSEANPSRSASATVKVAFSNASLNGRYAFLFSGTDAAGIFLAAGSFQADGGGNVVSGVEDLNSGSGVFENVTFTGNYSIGGDGRGSASISSSLGVSHFRFVLKSDSTGALIQFDASSTGSGSFAKQDPSAFSTSALNGGYAFGFSGLDSAGFAEVAAGRFTANGAGQITSGVEDINDSGTVSTNVAFTGTYAISSNGRGTATVSNSGGQSQFAFYVVSAKQLYFVELDFLPAVAGVAQKQSGAFSNSSLSGEYAFASSGASFSGVVASAGRFTADGSGNITSGLSDQNDSGLVDESITFTGVYSVASNGRGTASLTSSLGTTATVAFYLVSPGRAIFIGTGSLDVPIGVVAAQQGAPFSQGSKAKGGAKVWLPPSRVRLSQPHRSPVAFAFNWQVSLRVGGSISSVSCQLTVQAALPALRT